jgi:hypothetical protein
MYRRQFLAAALVIALAGLLTELARADAPEQGFQAGTIMAIDKNVVRTPLSYVFDVVASFYETVTYKLKIRVGQQVYDVEYAPDVQPNGVLPSDWVEGALVQVRIEKRTMTFSLPAGRELQARIVGRKKVAN